VRKDVTDLWKLKACFSVADILLSLETETMRPSTKKDDGEGEMESDQKWLLMRKMCSC
jgi:hypothetical protein